MTQRKIRDGGFPMQAYSCYIPRTYQNKILLRQTKNYFLLPFQKNRLFKQKFNSLLTRRNSLGMRVQTNVKLVEQTINSEV